MNDPSFITEHSLNTILFEMQEDIEHLKESNYENEKRIEELEQRRFFKKRKKKRAR